MTEAKISREIATFVRSVGGAVYSTEQGYRHARGGTRTTAGIPDLIIFVDELFTFVEVKRPGGKLTDAQEAFREACALADVQWQLWRDVRDAWDWLVREGVIKEADRG